MNRLMIFGRGWKRKEFSIDGKRRMNRMKKSYAVDLVE
jgi:hypothetical protein